MGGVELRDATFEKVSAAPLPLKLDSDDKARVGERVGSDSMFGHCNYQNPSWMRLKISGAAMEL